jgi:hypothetical protein
MPYPLPPQAGCLDRELKEELTGIQRSETRNCTVRKPLLLAGGAIVLFMLHCLEQRVAFLGQTFELLALFGDAIGITIFVARPRGCGGLFDQLPNVLANHGDVLLQFLERQGRGVAHVINPGKQTRSRYGTVRYL